MDIENKVPNFFKKYNIELGTHLLYDSAANKLFAWLAENVTDRNVLSDDELRDYFEMEKTAPTCQQQVILHGDELRNALEELNKKFPKLTSFADEDVKMYEKELVQVTELQEAYETILNDSKAVLDETKKKNFQMNKKLSHVQEHEERLNSEYLQNWKEMQEIQTHIQKSRQGIKSICSCVELSPCYMHQFPLEDFFLKCRDFNNYCDQYFRKSFKIIDSNASDIEAATSATGDDSYTKEIERIKQIINNSTFKQKIAEMKLSSLKSVIKELENFTRISYDYQDMKAELEQTTQENKEMDIKILTLKETLKKATEILNQQKVNRLVHDANSVKIQRAEQRLKDVKQIENISHKFLLHCELLWFTVNFDCDMLNSYKKVLKNDKIEERNHLNCLNRIAKLNSLLLEDPVANYTTEFSNEITKCLTRSNFNQITLKEYDDIVANIPVQLDTISNKSSYSDLNQMIKFLQENSSILIDLLDDGPLARPQVINVDILNVIYNCNIEKGTLTRKINEQKQKFKEEIKTKFQTNKIWKYNKILWIWFLTEPKKVIEAIEEVKVHEFKSRKLVSGLLCKRS